MTKTNKQHSIPISIGFEILFMIDEQINKNKETLQNEKVLIDPC